MDTIRSVCKLSEIEWLCVDVAGYKVINVYTPPPRPRDLQQQPSRRFHYSVWWRLQLPRQLELLHAIS